MELNPKLSPKRVSSLLLTDLLALLNDCGGKIDNWWIGNPFYLIFKFNNSHFELVPSDLKHFQRLLPYWIAEWFRIQQRNNCLTLYTKGI